MIRRHLIAGTLVSLLTVPAFAEEPQNVDVKQTRKELEGTILSKGLLSAFFPANVSVNTSSEYRRALDTMDVFLLAYNREQLSGDDQVFYDRCIDALLANAHVPNLTSGGVGVNDRVWNLLEREGIADYSARLRNLSELSRTLLGEAGKVATSGGKHNDIQRYADAAHEVAAYADELVRTAVAVQPLPGTVAPVGYDQLVSIVKSHKEAYDELMELKRMTDIDVALLKKLKEWHDGQKERFDSLLALQQQALDTVHQTTEDWRTVTVRGEHPYTRVVPARFAQHYAQMERSAGEIKRRLSGFTDLHAYIDSQEVQFGMRFVFPVGCGQDVHADDVLRGRMPGRREALVPLSLSRVLPVGSEFRIQFGKGGSVGTYTAVGVSSDTMLLGDTAEQLMSLDGVVATYTHQKYAKGRQQLLFEK